MPKQEFIDAVMLHTDHRTGKQHTTRNHYKSMDKIVDEVVKWQNPKITGATLNRVRIYDFFGNKVKDSYSENEFDLMEGYEEKLEMAKAKWNRNEQIDSLV